MAVPKDFLGQNDRVTAKTTYYLINNKLTPVGRN